MKANTTAVDKRTCTDNVVMGKKKDKRHPIVAVIMKKRKKAA